VDHYDPDVPSVRAHESLYDLDGLVLWGNPLELGGWPQAPDALVEVRGAASVSFSYDGPPRVGTRTRTGSDGSSAAFTYDDRGHLIEHDNLLFTHEDDRLVQAETISPSRVTRWTYDEDGNLERKEAEDDIGQLVVTTYTYECW
jgi:YD repeat-containing protein